MAATDDRQRFEKTDGFTEAPSFAVLDKDRSPDPSNLESEPSRSKMKQPGSVMGKSIDNLFDGLDVIVRQQNDCEHLQAGTHRPAFTGGVSEADDLRSLVVDQSFLDQFHFCRSTTDRAGDAEF